MTAQRNIKNCLQFALITTVAVGFALLPFVGGFSFVAQAATNTANVTVEVVPNPSGDADGEYISLTNTGDEEVDLFGFSLMDDNGELHSSL
jgi:hypothetical protein